MLSLTHVFGDTGHSPERDDRPKHARLHLYTCGRLTKCSCFAETHAERDGIRTLHVAALFPRTGPREAAVVVDALVRPALMRLMKHDPIALLDEFILPPPPLPVLPAPVPQPCFGKLRDGSCLQTLLSGSMTLQSCVSALKVKADALVFSVPVYIQRLLRFSS